MNTQVPMENLQEKPIEPTPDISRPAEQILAEEKEDRAAEGRTPLFVP